MESTEVYPENIDGEEYISKSPEKRNEKSSGTLERKKDIGCNVPKKKRLYISELQTCKGESILFQEDVISFFLSRRPRAGK